MVLGYFETIPHFVQMRVRGVISYMAIGIKIMEIPPAACQKSGTKFLKIFCTHIRRSDSTLLDFQVPRYFKSGLGRAGLGPWVGPWQCCAGAPAARRGAPMHVTMHVSTTRAPAEVTAC